LKELLIDFQLYLNDNDLITNHDWDYELEAINFLKDKEANGVNSVRLSIKDSNTSLNIPAGNLSTCITHSPMYDGSYACMDGVLGFSYKNSPAVSSLSISSKPSIIEVIEKPDKIEIIYKEKYNSSNVCLATVK
jgi:hypothetical protein